MTNILLMENRKCLNCNNPIPENKRADSKFCSNSCKAWYWEKQKENKVSNKPKDEIKEVKQEKKIEKGTPLNGLKGVINNTPKAEVKSAALPSANYPYKPVSDCLPTDKKEENPEYKKWQDKQVSLEAEIKREEDILVDINTNIKKLETVTKSGKDFDLNKKFISSSEMYQLRDALFFDEDYTEDIKIDKEKQEKLQRFKGYKVNCLQAMEKNKTSLKEVIEMLNKTPRYITVQRPKFSFWKSPERKNNEPQSEIKENEVTLGETGEKIETNSRIMSSKELMKLDYKSLIFQHRWKDFLGQPAVVFHFAIHGLPGGGKSTFCLQLADYLADNFGNVIYVSGEEGYSKTLKDKIILTKADSDNLYFHDAKNIEDIKEFVPAEKYNFIFIDSLDTLRIDAIKLKEFREHYPNSAFITISQSRKDGKMKGDNEILHDADSIIAVHNGTATLSKNRFNSIADKYFEVFPKKK